MRTFINMDFNGTQWWVEYNEDGDDKKEYLNEEDTEEKPVSKKKSTKRSSLFKSI